ncbi:MAG: hypothetical protein E7158_03490 [Firmicutes bacterium]|nr:hypothetical protein [Bacillota bacterium]
MNRGREFISNTIILFFGKFATQLVSFLCLPIYTRYLLTTDYGLIDLYQTFITLLIPFVNIRMDVAGLKFLSENRNKEEEKGKIISIIVSLFLISSFVSLIIGVVLSFFIHIHYFWYVLLNLIISSASIVFLQMLRGLKMNKEYSIACIITSITLLIFTMLLIIVMKMNAKSILIASSVANAVCIAYCLIKIHPKFDFKIIKESKTKQIIKYSTPMILDASSWWIVNVSDRTIISFFLGVAYNGIYSISCKFSNILNSIFLIFNMSWQEAIITHKNDPDASMYISKLGNEIIKLFLSISLIIVAAIPLVFDIAIGKDYISSYNYIPILLYSNIHSIISTLIGSILVVYGETKTIAKTTLISAVINIVINVLLIKYIGLFAAAFSTLIAYVIIGFLRYKKCKKSIDFNLNIKLILIYSLLFLISSLIYLYNYIITNVINILLIILCLIILNKNSMNYYINLIKKVKKS